MQNLPERPRCGSTKSRKNAGFLARVQNLLRHMGTCPACNGDAFANCRQRASLSCRPRRRLHRLELVKRGQRQFPCRTVCRPARNTRVVLDQTRSARVAHRRLHRSLHRSLRVLTSSSVFAHRFSARWTMRRHVCGARSHSLHPLLRNQIMCRIAVASRGRQLSDFKHCDHRSAFVTCSVRQWCL